MKVRTTLARVVAAGLCALASLVRRCAWQVREAAEEENLVSGISQDSIQITSNYTGSDIVVFGAIENQQSAAGRDVVVVVRGPDADIVVRRRDRVAGVWINHDSASLNGTLGLLLFSPARGRLADTAGSAVLARYGIGLQNLEQTGTASTAITISNPSARRRCGTWGKRNSIPRIRVAWNFSATRSSAPTSRCRRR